jgi:asparagine synthase (glutamine-hydrolysing)
MLDHEFVEWVVGLPAEWKYRAPTRKYVLKKLAERLGIPAELLHRPKQGFQLPLVDWMRNEMKEQYLSVLLESRTLQRGYFKPEAVRALVEEHACGRRNRSGMLWRMLILELWHRNFMESQAWRTVHTAPMISAIVSGVPARPSHSVLGAPRVSAH